MLTHAWSMHDSALWVQGHRQAFPSTGPLPVPILKQLCAYQKSHSLTFLFGCFVWILEDKGFS